MVPRFAGDKEKHRGKSLGRKFSHCGNPVVYIVGRLKIVKLARGRTRWTGVAEMKFAGFMLLLAGWGIVLAAVGILPSAGKKTAFVLAGLAVEIIGLALVARTYRTAQEERR